MKLTLALTAAAVALTSFGFAVPAAAAPARFANPQVPSITVAPEDVDRRGRRKPRVPGGSGCDDPRDIIEHPECTP